MNLPDMKGGEASYWEVLGHAPTESRAWREVRVSPPPPANESSALFQRYRSAQVRQANCFMRK